MVSEIEGSTEAVLEIETRQTDRNVLDWWSTIVCPGQGWISTIKFNNAEYQSPWSVFVSGKQRLGIRWASTTPDKIRQTQAPSFWTSLSFLVDFYETYGIHDQYLVALSVAILIPTVRRCLNRFSLPKVYHPNLHHQSINGALWVHAVRIPYDMSIGCNTTGPVSPLSASIFDTSIALQLCMRMARPNIQDSGPLWKQNDHRTFLNVSSLQEPRLAPSWLGALIINFEPHVMRTVRPGTLMVDLTCSMKRSQPVIHHYYAGRNGCAPR